MSHAPLFVTLSALSLLLLLAGPASSQAEPPSRKEAAKASRPSGSAKAAAPAPAPAPAGPGNSAASQDKLIRETWYTMTLARKIPYGYYSERVELRKGRLFFQNHVWKVEEDYINEDQLGAYAENDAALTPLFYNFHSTYRASEGTIDATVQDGRMFTAKVRKGTAELPVIRRSIPPGTFFAQFFPVWLGRQHSPLQAGKPLSFRTLPEENPEAGIAVGRVQLEKPDELATRTGTRKLSVVYNDQRSLWWVDDAGTALRIEMPANNIVVEQATKEKAQTFLSKAE